MAIAPDSWLAGVLGVPAFRLSAASPGAAADADEVRRHVEAHETSFTYARLDTARVAEVRHLTRAGFAVVDVSLTFVRDRPGTAEAPRAGAAASVRAFRPEDAAGVLAIAGSAFRFSRFHLDPLLAPGAADHVKREWMRSYVRGVRGDRLFVAEADGRPAGFLAALAAGEGRSRSATIDLVAVATDHARRGLGRALVEAFAGHYQGARLEVGTQAANVPSVRLYEQAGFSLASSQYVLHLHVADRKPIA